MTLSDGAVHKADIIVAADGEAFLKRLKQIAHSTMKELNLSRESSFSDLRTSRNPPAMPVFVHISKGPILRKTHYAENLSRKSV